MFGVRRVAQLRQKVAFAGVLVGLLAFSGCGGEPPTYALPTDGGGGAPQAETRSHALALARFDETFSRYATNPEDTRQRKHFRDAFNRVRAEYVETVPDEDLINAAIAGIEEKAPAPGSMPPRELVEIALDAMTSSLDPHSTYLNADELRDTEISLSGRFGGLGIRVAREDGEIRIISPIEGTPADKAGIKAGDRVTHVDGQPVVAMTLMQAVNAMRGEPGTRIVLKIKRDSRPPFDVTLTRAVINIQPARWSTYGTVGYLRIVNFNVNSAEVVENAVAQIRQHLGSRMTGLVIDLRRNPGGAFGQAIQIADAFLDEGIIVEVRGRGGQTLREHRATRGDVAGGLPIVLLIDGGSASASEIVASALQDHNRALVMGSRSFGKGSVQTLLRLPEEGAVKLTTALYYAPSGRSIQAMGVAPQVDLVNAEESEVAVGDDVVRRESDLPGAFPSQGRPWSAESSRINTSMCVPLGSPEDRELGCAVAVLRAGSVEEFLTTTRLRGGDG